jgi:hypothetical protein
VAGFVLRFSGKIPLPGVMTIKVQGEEEVIWVVKEDVMAPD